MATPASTGRTWAFGVYEVDTRRGELRRNGKRVRLREQSFLILVCLLEHSGETVTREDLRQVLWTSDVFVDFEHGLSMAILKLREALGDSAEKPRYIETVPRRGYRFIAPASVREAVEDKPEIPAPSPETGPGGSPVEERKSRLRLLIWRTLLIGIASLAALAGILLVINPWHILRGRTLRLPGSAHATTPAFESIAVLPLEDLSADRSQAYFSFGLTDTLITYLGQIVPLRVISRASVMRYAGGRTPLPQIARELNVDAVVEGTVQRADGKVFISVQLLDARADRHLWAKTYEHGGEDLLRFENQVALSIAHEVSSRVQPAQERRLLGSRAVNPEAYDDYLRGRYLLGQRTAEGEAGARAYFDEARHLDPGFAPAYSGLADTYTVSWFINKDFALAEQYGWKAIALDPALAEGHASVGIAELYQFHFAEAGKELEHAAALNPNYAMAQHWYSLYLLYQGRATEALAVNDRARQLDPYSFPINFLRGVILMNLREHDRAVAQLQFAASINPDSPPPHMALQRIYWMEGRVGDALAEERIFATLSHHTEGIRAIEEVAAANRNGGLKAARMKDIEVKQRLYMRQPHPDPTSSSDLYSAQEIGLRYALLGDRTKTLAWLNRALQDDPTDFPLILTEPSLTWLRSDPEFQALLRRAGLPLQAGLPN